MGAEDIDKDTAEDISYWKKPKDPPCDIDFFHNLSCSGHWE